MSARQAKRAPSPASHPLIGHAAAFRRDPLGFLRTTERDCGGLARLRLGPLVYHFVSAPALIAEVLQTRAAHYVRYTRSSRNIALVTGESLLSTNGEDWRRHRRLVQPIFHQKRLAALARAMVEAATEAVESWENASRSDDVLDLAAEMSRLTFLIVGRALFSTDLGPRAHAMEAAFPALLDELFRRAQSAVDFPLWLPTTRHARFRRALATLDEIVTGLLARRRRETASRDDLLGLLLQARDEDGSAFGDAEIRNHIVTFLLAGHETTATLLTWTLCLLDRHRAEGGRIEAELDTVLGMGPPNGETLSRLVYVDAVLHETLRLYPPIWIVERRLVNDEVLGGFALPAGSSVVVSPFITHRRGSSWAEPEEFRPGRFTGGERPTLLSHGYFPFGAGPHQCIGQHFALLEARIALTALCSRFRVRLVRPELPRPRAGITLRPDGAVPVRIERR